MDILRKMSSTIQTRASQTSFNQPIIIMQSPSSRAINLGFIQKNIFLPGRLNLGATREKHTYSATVDCLRLAPVQQIINRFDASQISTITVLRETLACRLAQALIEVGISAHFGDAFIGATHVKQSGKITTAYLYENIEGLHPTGLWLIADSICVGRNLEATMKSLLSKFHPKEILFICPISSKLGIENVSKIIDRAKIPVTFVAWGALFGVSQKNWYDMPWGHPDTQALDLRDQETFVKMYGPQLCVGGDFGNNYFCPALAKKLYQDQLKKHHITPHIPTKQQILNIYKLDELLVEN